MAYEVWERTELENHHSGQAIETCYVIDTAIDFCKKLSVGNTTKKVWQPKLRAGGNPMWGMPEGEYVDMVVPKAYALVERTTESLVRGWGIDGVWFDRKDCKRCVNTGENGLSMCSSCKGSSINPLR